MIEYYERFKAVREQVGLSQAGLAKKLDIAPSVISEIERGTKEPSRSVLLAYAKELDININWLLLGEGEMFCNATPKVIEEIKTKECEIKRLKKSIADLENTYRTTKAENDIILAELRDKAEKIIMLQDKLLSIKGN